MDCQKGRHDLEQKAIKAGCYRFDLDSFTMLVAGERRLGRYSRGQIVMNDPKQTATELDIVMEWVTEQLKSKGDVPRVEDVIRYAHQTLGYRHLKRASVARRLRLHSSYLMSSSQTRGQRRSRRYRPIVTNTLGMWHGDIGYFSVKREYETPITYRAGYLVFKDILSGYMYAIILRKNKSADSIIRAIERVLQQHKQRFSHHIKSISFDQETSVMSNKVQSFLRDNSIAFHAFKYSSSKS